MMAVSIQTQPTFHAGAPKALFERELKTGVYDSLSYDIATDGQEFLMIERRLELAPNQISVVLDWGRELQQKVPIR
jgi:hypothetical protein